MQQTAYENNPFMLPGNFSKAVVWDRDLRPYLQQARALTPGTPTDDVALKALIDQVSHMALATRYENPILIAMMGFQTAMLCDAAARGGKPIPDNVYIGTLPLPNLNASTFYFNSSGDRLIVLHTEVNQYVTEAVACLVMLLTEETSGGVRWRRPDRVRALMSVDSEARRSLFNVIEWQVAVNVQQRSVLRTLKPGQLRLAIQLAGSAMSFVLGHEFGHVLNDDHGQAFAVVADPVGPRWPAVEEVIYDWKHEFLADRTGADLVLDSLMIDGKSQTEAVWGPEIFLLLLEVYEYASDIARDGVPVAADPGQDARVVAEELAQSLLDAMNGGQPPAAPPPTVGQRLSDHPPTIVRRQGVRRQLSSRSQLPSVDVPALVRDAMTEMWPDLEADIIRRRRDILRELQLDGD